MLKALSCISGIVLGTSCLSSISVQAKTNRPPVCVNFMAPVNTKIIKTANGAKLYVAYRGTLVGGKKGFRRLCSATFPIKEMPAPYDKWQYVAGSFVAEKSVKITRNDTRYYARCRPLMLDKLSDDSLTVEAEIRNEWTGRKVICQFSGWIEVKPK